MSGPARGNVPAGAAPAESVLADTVPGVLRELGIDPQLMHARGLRRYPEATGLEVVQVDADGREHRLVPSAAASWLALRHAAAADGIGLHVVSAYRSVERQARIIRHRLERGEALAGVLTVLAPPGYSEHHTGRAVDVGTPGAAVVDPGFVRTDAYRWLMQHAGGFGFVLSYPEGNASGYAFEPWHWCHHPGPDLSA